MKNHYSILSTQEDKLFAESIAKKLRKKLHLVNHRSFASGEPIAWPSQSVRGQYVFIVHQYNDDVCKEFMRMLTLIDGCKRASAEKIILIDPFFPFQRQDYRSEPRQGITARVAAKMIDNSGASQLITFDMHSKQSEGFFDTPVINIGASTMFTEYLKNKIPTDNLFIASADVGGVERAKKFADKLGVEFVLMHKVRSGPGKVEKVYLIGDVVGKNVMLVDDMTDSGNTIARAAEKLYDDGAVSVSACITHLLHESKAAECLGNSRLEKVFVTNSFTHETLPDNFEVLDLTDKLSEVIGDIINKRSAKIY
jgi:ribose-phosphate pyrophosphokinase